MIDLRDLLGDDADQAPARLVTVRVDASRRVGLLVDEVLGLRDAASLHADSLPPLLRDARQGAIDELARLDGRLLTILRAGSLLPEDVWAKLAEAT